MVLSAAQRGGGYGPDRPRLALPYPKQVFQEAGGYGEVGWTSLPYHTPEKVGTLMSHPSAGLLLE